jgi:hypothetical protein
MKFETQPQQVLWFRDRFKENCLELKPPFQRKPVWVAKQKCFLIESILLELPIPEVFVQQTIIDADAHYAVVDGQQLFFSSSDYSQKSRRRSLPGLLLTSSQRAHRTEEKPTRT